MVANVDSMFFTGETPWHGLGVKLENPATAREAILAAKLDWRVSTEPAILADCTQLLTRAVRRLDTRAVLGEVGRLYQPIQNDEAFCFFDSVVGSGQAIYHTAGALGKGDRVWILARLPGEIRVQNTDDVTHKYLLLCNSHDGKMALRMFFTPVRVVCQNTLNMALSAGMGSGVSIRHLPGLKGKIQEAQRALGLAVRYYDDAEGLVNLLARTRPGSDVIRKYVRSLFPDHKDELVQMRHERIREEVLDLYAYGRTNNLPGVCSTWWAAYNAVTEHADHARRSRGRTDQERREKKLASIWFGPAAQLKRRAWKLALLGAGVEA
jgi:phage/plasmid-like protein (TIGR03299 family)